MDTIYNFRDLPIGIYCIDMHDYMRMSEQNSSILHTDDEEGNKIRIWSCGTIAENYNKWLVMTDNKFINQKSSPGQIIMVSSESSVKMIITEY